MRAALGPKFCGVCGELELFAPGSGYYCGGCRAVVREAWRSRPWRGEAEERGFSSEDQLSHRDKRMRVREAERALRLMRLRGEID